MIILEVSWQKEYRGHPMRKKRERVTQISNNPNSNAKCTIYIGLCEFIWHSKTNSIQVAMQKYIYIYISNINITGNGYQALEVCLLLNTFTQKGEILFKIFIFTKNFPISLNNLSSCLDSSFLVCYWM